MIESLYGSDMLNTPKGFLLAYIIGVSFGWVLERAGFGSSRRLSAIFYFRDMTVLKVMFTAVITAMIGLIYCINLGIIDPAGLYYMPSVYGAQIAGGLIFGAGFVMGGWCPGTAAVGMASGKIDAFLFIVGSFAGSILFNESFSLIKPLYTMGDSGVSFAYSALGMSQPAFAFLFTLVAVACFWGSEYVERAVSGTGEYLGTPFLKAFSLALVSCAAMLFVFTGSAREASGEMDPGSGAAPPPAISEAAILEGVGEAADHIEPEELADALADGEKGLLVVDVRPPDEFRKFNIRGAVNVELKDLADFVRPYKNSGRVVLYSNGMTHPAQARDSLARLGYQNVYILTDGLAGFTERCLKPVSLRKEPLSASDAGKVAKWRRFFNAAGTAGVIAGDGAAADKTDAPAAPALKTEVPPATANLRLVETVWLKDKLGSAGLKIIDLRPQPEYNRSHIPGAMSLNVESIRGFVDAVPSMLLPAKMLVEHFSMLGLSGTDHVVICYGDKPHDAAIFAIALERVGHAGYSILNGGFAKWEAEKYPVDNRLPAVTRSEYPLPKGPDDFSVGYKKVLEASSSKSAVIIDVRPSEFYSGKKSDEARAGHIPGALNRPYTEDVVKTADIASLKPVDELEKEYLKIVPSRETQIIIHCRTGHQASQTFFVMKSLLGYKNVKWYDGGWTEWSSKEELPIEK
jgi:thiosulfate/3-mercaptopyruvate sulfurtransferase